MGPAFAGLSYDKTAMYLPLFRPENSTLIELFRNLGPSMLRIGGYSVDLIHWAAGGPGLTSGQVAPTDIDALAQFIQQTGWTVLYSVNLAFSTPADAAAEVAYASGALGKSLYGVELGNEPNIYGAYHYFPTWTPQDFEQRWQQFRDAIVQATPDVVMTGPSCVAATTGWTLPFARDLGNEIGLLTQHYYRGSGLDPSSTIAEMLSQDSALTDDLALLKAATDSIGIPFRLDETNSFWAGGAIGVSDSYASALWVIDHLFNIALGGGAGANMTGGGNTGGYTPIADDNGVVVEARPEYYGLLLFSLAGQGDLLAASISAPAGLNLTAYAVASSQGCRNIVVVNKDATTNLSLTIAPSGLASRAELWLLTGPALDATSGTMIQGSSVAQDGTFCPGSAYSLPVLDGTIRCYLGAASAALIRIS